MKVRESGMPGEEVWSEFFEPKRILKKLGIDKTIRDIADFGCGYGTFTIPVAQTVKGKVYAIDIEPDMVEETKRKAEKKKLGNVKVILRDPPMEIRPKPEQIIDWTKHSGFNHPIKSDLKPYHYGIVMEKTK